MVRQSTDRTIKEAGFTFVVKIGQDEMGDSLRLFPASLSTRYHCSMPTYGGPDLDMSSKTSQPREGRGTHHRKISKTASEKVINL